MSQLRSLITEATSFDPGELTIGQLADEIAEVVHAQQLLEVALTGWVKNLSDRCGHAELGYPSPTAFLVHQGRMSAGHAKQVVARGHAAVKAPAAHAAWTDGRLSTDQTRPIFALAESVPDQYPEAEQQLVEIVEGLSVSDTGKVLEYWRQSVDGPGDVDAEAQWARRGMSSTKTIGGMRYVEAWLTPSAGDAFDAAIDAHMPPPTKRDTRTARQRRHDALEDMCRNLLDNGATPTVGGEKPHILLLSDIPALQGIAGGTHETLAGDIISIDTLRRIACDASITRIVLGPDSEILDIGRKTRVWTAAQRRAIIARDRHCQAEGCDRDWRFCDIHHEDHWADGGTTSVDKGKLYCRFHHTKEHIRLALERRRRRRTKG